jgi:hypothetical protein
LANDVDLGTDLATLISHAVRDQILLAGLEIEKEFHVVLIDPFDSARKRVQVDIRAGLVAVPVGRRIAARPEDDVVFKVALDFDFGELGLAADDLFFVVEGFLVVDQVVVEDEVVVLTPLVLAADDVRNLLILQAARDRDIGIGTLTSRRSPIATYLVVVPPT